TCRVTQLGNDIYISRKVEGGNQIVCTNRLTHRRTDYGVNRTLIVKFDFCFGRVDIYVYVPWIDFDKQYIERKTVFSQQSFKCIHYRVIQVVASNEALIDKQELFTTCFAGK